MNGFLDKDEAKKFMGAVVLVIQEERAENYDADKFNQMFDQFDEDQNGYLSKGEMS